MLLARTVSTLTAVLTAALFLMTGAVVTTTVTMSVLERKRELGLYSSWGYRRWSLVAMLAGETPILQFIATVAAIGLAVGDPVAGPCGDPRRQRATRPDVRGTAAVPISQGCRSRVAGSCA